MSIHMYAFFRELSCLLTIMKQSGSLAAVLAFMANPHVAHDTTIRRGAFTSRLHFVYLQFPRSMV